MGSEERIKMRRSFFSPKSPGLRAGYRRGLTKTKMLPVSAAKKLLASGDGMEAISPRGKRLMASIRYRSKNFNSTSL
jgi:hypothetical protein